MPERRSVDPQARERARARLAARRARAAQEDSASHSALPASQNRRGGGQVQRTRNASNARKRSSRSGSGAPAQPSSKGFGAALLSVVKKVLLVIGMLLARIGGLLWQVFRRLPGKAQVVVALVLLALVLLGGYSCVSSFAAGNSDVAQASDRQADSQPQDQTQTQKAQEPQTDFERMDLALLSDYLGDEGLDTFVEAAKKDDDLAWIGAHVRDYDYYGYEIQAKLLKLAMSEPAAVDFVRNYVDMAGSTDAQPCDPVEEGSVPALYQWDTRWAYADYSRSVIGLAGCGPTAMCMVYQGLTGQSDKSPYDFAMDAIAHDYVHGGTDPGFYVWEAQDNGLTYEELEVSASALKKALNSGNVVICNVGPGDFTQVGHFIVLCGIADDGKLKVNDPYSKVRSEKTWDIDQVIDQTQALMSFGSK